MVIDTHATLQNATKELGCSSSAEVICDGAGAKEKHDSWAECLLTWLQGQPAAALQKLMPQPQPDQATLSSDRSLTPGQLNTNPPTTSGRRPTSALPSSTPTPSTPHHHLRTQPPASGENRHTGSALLPGGRCDQALALDLLAYCLTPAGSITWPGPLPALGQLYQLASEAAHALEVTGHPVMALEALHIAQQCCKRFTTDSPSHSQPPQHPGFTQQQQQQQVLNNWQERLVTACLVRCLVDATQPEPCQDPLLPLATGPLNPQDAQHLISQRWTLHRNRALTVTPLPKPTQWKKLAQQQLGVLVDAGVHVIADKAMTRLQATYDSLLVNPGAEGEEGGGVEVGGAGLFRSISGISAASTPCRNSTFSRSCSFFFIIA